METAKRIETELDDDFFVNSMYNYSEIRSEIEIEIEKQGFISYEKI